MNQNRHRASLLGLILISLMIFALLLQSCEPGGDIIIENRQNKEVTIYFSHVRGDGSTDEPAKQGVISANATRTFNESFPRKNWVSRIEVVDSSGNVVFSHDYNMDDLEKIDWKIVIPPS